MANRKQLQRLKKSVKNWNAWRVVSPTAQIDLSGANLSGADLSDTNLNHADLSSATLIGVTLTNTNLSGATLNGANLFLADFRNATLSYTDLSYTNLDGADLSGANLSHADLSHANLHHSCLSGANLSHANLNSANLSDIDLNGADLTDAKIGWTNFDDLNLETVKGLETIHHGGPSYLDYYTIINSHGNISGQFLRGAGLSNTFIEYIHSFVNTPIDYYSCFISYSDKDSGFARRLYNDLQGNNVRCWFAPEHMKIGSKMREDIDTSIRLYDRLLIVLSEHSVESAWVEHEVETALDKEREGKPNVLFPVRVDETVMSKKTWMGKSHP